MSPRGLVVALALFAGLTAVAGGAVLALGGPGLPPRAWLAHTPFTTYLVPGLLLAIVIGGTSVAAAALTWRRGRFAIDATILAGGALTVWIGAELAMIRELSFLQAVYAALGLALLGLGVRAAWRSGSARYRWTLVVTGAEALGFLAPSLAGIAATRAGLSPLAQAAVLAGAGFTEGFVLGLGQATALPFRVRRLRFALVTGAGAALVWTSVMALMSAPDPRPLVPVVAGVGLLAIGSLQWLELRHHRTGAARWIGWTALAWTLALPLSFAPGPFVDETTPLAVHVALWGAGGLLMAAVMATVTWQGVVHLGPLRRRAGARAAPPFAVTR